ncbi:TPA: hypothetical protein N2901_004445 [Vibrio parahaemolyticus]|nr:hypothetical protein [Vibrio parahaemolyticus]
MTLTSRKATLWTLLILFLIWMAFFLYGLINSLFCSYNLSLSYSKESVVNVTCRSGKVSAIHSLVSEGGKVIPYWRVSARQILIGNQLIYIIWDREKIQALDTFDTQVDNYNYSMKNFKTLFYFIKRRGDELVIFEKFPDENIYIADVKGKLGFIEPD